jgi:hypothetical protein
LFSYKGFLKKVEKRGEKRGEKTGKKKEKKGENEEILFTKREKYGIIILYGINFDQ